MESIATSTPQHPPDAHAKPPESIKAFYKRLQKADKNELASHPDIVDGDPTSDAFSQHLLEKCHGFGLDLPSDLRRIFSDFVGDSSAPNYAGSQPPPPRPVVYEVRDIPGLFIYPNLLPQAAQISLLDKLLHRDLADSRHQTNVHLHYDVPYPSEEGSFFDESAEKLTFTPKAAHKPITTAQFLQKKVRWVTTGGQYDWTAKRYPSGPPPPFPRDVQNLVESIFPMKVEAAITNIYSAGDTLAIHRDVSEECQRPLVSISLGCEGIFVVGLDADPDAPSDELKREENVRMQAIRLRSGDALLMSGPARFAWHGIPRVLADSCPEWLQDWPAVGGGEERFVRWRGWMGGKRINFNVRQMFDGDAVNT